MCPTVEKNPLPLTGERYKMWISLKFDTFKPLILDKKTLIAVNTEFYQENRTGNPAANQRSNAFSFL